MLQTAPVVSASDPGAPVKPKLICKTDAPTGSRIASSRVCKTAAEWEARSKADRAVLERSLSDRNHH